MAEFTTIDILGYLYENWPRFLAPALGIIAAPMGLRRFGRLMALRRRLVARGGLLRGVGKRKVRRDG